MKTRRQGLIALIAFAWALPAFAEQIQPPAFSPAPGPYRGSQVTVTIQCGTPAVTIFYTTDGSDPTPSSRSYSGGFSVSGTTTVKARAYKYGMTESRVVSATYTSEQALRTVAAPVLQPPSHTFTAPEVIVGAACGESGAVIRYTTNESEPTATSPAFPSRLAVTQTTTVKARAFKAGMADSPVATAVYTKGALRTAPAPVLDPPRERFTPPFSVVMGCEDRQAEIRYTLDGSEPTASSPRYVSPVQLTETKTVKARAFKAGMAPSGVVTGVYEKDSRPIRRPVLDPPSRSFTPPLEVVAGCEDRLAEIRYTLDGSEPSASSPRYSGPIRLTEAKTVKARAFRAGMTPSEVVTGVYTREALRTVPAPALEPSSQTFVLPTLPVVAKCSESGAVIRYTLDGSEPTIRSPQYAGPILIVESKTVKVRAFKAGMVDSPVTTATYTKGALRPVPAPVLEPSSQTFVLPTLPVVAKCSESGAVIRYTLDGSEPTIRSPQYSGPILIVESKTVKVRAFKAGMVDSAVTTATYTKGALRPVPAPVLEPSSQTFVLPTLPVVAKCSESGAVIRYTLDGSEPTIRSQQYSGPILIVETKTVKVRAFKAGMVDSPVVTATYTKLAVTPTPAKGVVTPEERARTSEECGKLLALQKEVERLQKEIERIRKERTERRKKLGIDPDPDCRIR